MAKGYCFIPDFPPKLLTMLVNRQRQSFKNTPGVWSTWVIGETALARRRFTCHSRPSGQAGDGMDHTIEQSRLRP